MREDIRKLIELHPRLKSENFPPKKIAPGPLPKDFKKVLIKIVLEMEDVCHDSRGETWNDLMFKVEEWMKALKQCSEVSVELRRKEQG